MKTLHMMVGLPRSGKSTLAKKMGFPIVERDAIRSAVHGTPYRQGVEVLCRGFAQVMIQSLFNAGHEDVILDGTNLTKKQRSLWVSDEWIVMTHYVPTSFSTCIARAIATDQSYLCDVIRKLENTKEIEEFI